MVKIIVQQTFRTFKEFSTNVYKNIMSLGVEIKAERTDIAADQYFKHSLKGGTQKDRKLEASSHSMTRQNSLMIS